MRNGFDFLVRDARWLTRDRAIAASRILFVMLSGLVLTSPWTLPDLQVGRDFAAFWTAGRAALAGSSADAYGAPTAAAMAALFGPGLWPPFFYPPIALFLGAVFALMPFSVAVGAWGAVSGALYAVAMRRLLQSPVLICALATPSVFICLLYGQNALLTAALYAGIAMTLDDAPVLAGALIGCLAYKPQLAVLAPIALVAAGRWHAFASAAVVVTALVGAATVVFGVDAWRGFIDALGMAESWNAGGLPGYEKFVSVYAAVRLLGGSSFAGWMLQWSTALLAIAVLIAVVRRSPGGGADTAALVTATAFCVPFLGQYDLVMQAVAGAWIAREAMATEWLPYERIGLAILFWMPLVIIAVGAHGVSLAPFALLALNALVVRRALQVSRSVAIMPTDARAGVCAR